MNPLLSPDLFVGRDDQLGQVGSLLRQGRSTLLIGGRRAGKTTLVRHLSADGVQRNLIRTDAAGWDLTTEATALGALRGALEHRPETAHGRASRNEVLDGLAGIRPVALVIDEADRLLQTGWGPGFYSFLRWLDDTHLRTDISLLLVGGPALVLFRDPDDRGSPPLNTAEVRYLDPLRGEAVEYLSDLAAEPAHERVLDLAGGHAWLTTRLLAEVWEGQSLDDAADIVFDRALSTFRSWRQQLGPDGMSMLDGFPAEGLSRAAAKSPPWSRHRQAARLARCVGALRLDGERLLPGPRMFFDWLAHHSAADVVWDIAISYASEDEALARQLHAQLRTSFSVFFAPETGGQLWGTDLEHVLPNTYGAQSRYVLVLSTPAYVAKYWTRLEYDSVAQRHPDRILLLDMGQLPADLPAGLVRRGSSPAELVGLVDALRAKLAQ
ncbi:AAA family ATPase [Dactylosporangium sp. CS-033363]|uniref:AAA family ATPase n=1 Tax=Dactylosporangium sp. CS-033363 TaxID=3239935 RepID=UPI003D939AD1